MARGNETPERKTGVASWNEGSRAAHHNKAEADRRRRVTLLVLLAIVCVASVVYAWPLGARITRGLWLKGGTAVTMVASAEEGKELTSQDLNSAMSIISRRVNDAGISEVATRAEGDDHVVVTLPWSVDADSLAGLLCGQGKLEFVSMDEIGDADAVAKLNAGGTNAHMKDGTYTAFLDGSHVSSASTTEASRGDYAITFVFDDEGKKIFADKTRELAEENGRIAIAIDGTVVSAASVSQAIDGGLVSISGDYTADEANAIKAVVGSGTAPVKLVLEGSEEVGPLLGGTGLWAIVGVAVAIFVGGTAFAFMRFKKLAVLTCGSMVVYATTLFGLMALASTANMFVLTMPGVVVGFVLAVVSALATWRVSAAFQTRVAQGGSVRGAALSCVTDGLKPLAAPVGVAFVAALVMLFLPLLVLREVGLEFVLGTVSGLFAVFWYAVTLLRLLSMGTIQEDPAAWGLEESAIKNAQGSVAS